MVDPSIYRSDGVIFLIKDGIYAWDEYALVFLRFHSEEAAFYREPTGQGTTVPCQIGETRCISVPCDDLASVRVNRIPGTIAERGGRTYLTWPRQIDLGEEYTLQ